MPKYYVKSRTLQVIINHSDPLEAGVAGLLMTNKMDIIDEYFYIDERGFRDYVSADNRTNVIPTSSIIRAAESELTDDTLP
jgi:hypothetical protein